MIEILPHIVRRGIEAVPLQEHRNECQASTSHYVVAGILLTIFAICMALFQYAYHVVFITLNIVEQPTYTSVLLNDDPQTPLLPEEARANTGEEAVVANKPVTSSIRATTKLLRDIGGPLSLFRGFGLFLTYQILSGMVQSVHTPSNNRFVPDVVTVSLSIIFALVFAQWMMGLTWIVLSEPSPLNWWRRIPPRSTWPKILPATAVFAVAQQVTMLVPLAILYVVIPHLPRADIWNPQGISPVHAWLFEYLLIIVIYAAAALLIMTPAKICLVRVHASMLPEETEAIVTFDRTYGGKVVPEILGGKGCLGIMDAIRSFEFSSWVRLLKMYLKIFAMQVAFILVLCIPFGVQAIVFFKYTNPHCRK